MMISTRNGHLIYGKVAVPVREVTEKICDRQTIEQICDRYPLTSQGVMECLDAVADLDKFDSGIHLELMDTNNNSGVLTLEARSMSDVFFLNISHSNLHRDLLHMYNEDCMTSTFFEEDHLYSK